MAKPTTCLFLDNRRPLKDGTLPLKLTVYYLGKKMRYKTPFKLTKDDFQKRKRTKNIIPNYERCCALRLNGDRCTRKKKDKEEFCGTHLKGKPYGIIEETQAIEKNKTAIWVEDIGGIHQYIDGPGNIYSTEDILQSVKNPRIIGKK